MDYKELVVKSFALAWRHKWLWVFGLFAGGGGVGGGFNFNFGPGSFDRSEPGTDPRFRAFLYQVGRWALDNLALIIALAVAAALLILFFFILNIIAQGSLIGAAERLDKDEETTFGQALGVGLHNFWSLLGFFLLLALVILVPLGFVAAFAAALALVSPLTLILFVPLIFVLIPVFLAAGIIGLLGARGIVIDGLGASAALADAWRLFWRRLGPVILTWLISMGLGIAFGFILVIAMLMTLGPIVVAAYLAFRTGFSLVKLGIFIFIGVAFLAAVWIVAAAFNTYMSVYWTVAYRRIKALDQPA